MKPDLRGVNQWGPGAYSELRKQRELPTRAPRGTRAREALRDKRAKHRYMVTLNPELQEFARAFGGGKLSTGLNMIIHIAKMSGATPMTDFVSGDVYETLNIHLSQLQQRVESLERTVLRLSATRKRQVNFTTTTQKD